MQRPTPRVSFLVAVSLLLLGAECRPYVWVTSDNFSGTIEPKVVQFCTNPPQRFTIDAGPGPVAFPFTITAKTGSQMYSLVYTMEWPDPQNSAETLSGKCSFKVDADKNGQPVARSAITLSPGNIQAPYTCDAILGGEPLVMKHLDRVIAGEALKLQVRVFSANSAPLYCEAEFRSGYVGITVPG